MINLMNDLRIKVCRFIPTCNKIVSPSSPPPHLQGKKIRVNVAQKPGGATGPRKVEGSACKTESQQAREAIIRTKMLEYHVHCNLCERKIACAAKVCELQSCHVTCYTSHVTRHTSHVTRHTSRRSTLC